MRRCGWSVNGPIAVTQDTSKFEAMWKYVPSWAIGLTFLLPAALFNAVAFGGQWRCGLMGAQAIFGDVVAAIGVTLAIQLWPRRSSGQSGKRMLLISTWALLFGCVVYILFVAPDCPYLAR